MPPAFGGLGGDLRPGPPAVRGGEADQFAGGIGADGRQGAHRVPVDDDAGPAAHRDPVVGSRGVARQTRQANSTATSAATNAAVRLCKATLLSAECRSHRCASLNDHQSPSVLCK